MWVLDEMVEGIIENGGLGDDVVGAGMNESPMSSATDVGELLVVVSVEGEEAVVNNCLMPSRSNDEQFVLDLAVERDEAVVNKTFMPCGRDDEELVIDAAFERDAFAMTLSGEVVVGGNSSVQLVHDSTGDEA